MIIRSAAAALVLLAACRLAGQAPRLDPAPVPEVLQEVDFKLERIPPLLIHSTACVVLFDDDANQVVCIDPKSGATRRFGRKGSGPGEFTAGSQMIETAGGGVAVFDFQQSRLTLVDRNWKLDRVIPLRQLLFQFVRSTADTIYAIGGDMAFFGISLRDGGMARHFAPADGDSTKLFQGSKEYERGAWLVPRRAGGYYAVSPWHYTILVEDESGMRRSSFGRALPPERPSAREVDEMRALNHKFNPQLSRAALDRLVDEWAKAPKPEVGHRPVEDVQGRLWVVSGRIRSDSTEIDVFGARSDLLGTRRIPGDVQAIAIHGNDLYAAVKYLSGERDGLSGVLHYWIR